MEPEPDGVRAFAGLVFAVFISFAVWGGLAVVLVAGVKIVKFLVG